MQALQNGFHDLQGCRKLKYVVSSAQWHEDIVIPNVPEVYTISSTCSLSQEENFVLHVALQWWERLHVTVCTYRNSPCCVMGIGNTNV